LTEEKEKLFINIKNPQTGKPAVKTCGKIAIVFWSG